MRQRQVEAAKNEFKRPSCIETEGLLNIGTKIRLKCTLPLSGMMVCGGRGF